MCTTKYIYQALFLEHRNSDIAVHALGKVWHLHKIYLCQSPYFASLFSGAWRESVADQCANIDILDPQITLAGKWDMRSIEYRGFVCILKICFVYRSGNRFWIIV